jgi:hypothetical protein
MNAEQDQANRPQNDDEPMVQAPGDQRSNHDESIHSSTSNRRYPGAPLLNNGHAHRNRLPNVSQVHANARTQPDPHPRWLETILLKKSKAIARGHACIAQAGRFG